MGRLDSNKFKSAYKTFVAYKNIRVNTKNRGFTELRAKVWYIARLRVLQVLVTTKKSKNNKCVSHSISESIKWPQGSKDFPAMRLHMEAILERTRKQVIARTWPPKDNHLHRCNTTGKDTMKFMEDTCTYCVCWYCTVSQ